MNKFFLSINIVLLLSSYGLNLHAADENPIKLENFSRPHRVLLANILRNHPHAFDLAQDVICALEMANRASNQPKERKEAFGDAIFKVETSGGINDSERADYAAIVPVLDVLVDSELAQFGLTRHTYDK